MNHEEIRILSPTAILGYGFPMESFAKGMEKLPHVIAVDAGSTDPGPHYLGAGISFTEKDPVKRDLAVMIRSGVEKGIPVIVGTSGGSGANEHLQWCLDIVREIAQEYSLRFKLASISAQVDKTFLLQELNAGNVERLGPVEALTRKNIEDSSNIVGQMGVEPFIEALKNGADVIIAGRAYDPAVFAAYPIMQGYDAGLALHLGKILECASIAAIPGSGSDCMLGTLRHDHFLVEPLNPDRRCTVTSVSAHTLYEKTDPYVLPGPGGVLDLKECEFFQETHRSVRVEKTRFIKDKQYTIKLEGAAMVGYRTISIAGARDPVFINKLDEILKNVRTNLETNLNHIKSNEYELLFRVYGRDGVMGALEIKKDAVPHEVGIVIEAVAKTQDLANAVVSFARSTMLHYGYPGRLSTAGNLAFPYSPSDFKAGSVYRFSIHHLLKTEDPLALFPISYTWVNHA